MSPIHLPPTSCTTLLAQGAWVGPFGHGPGGPGRYVGPDHVGMPRLYTVAEAPPGSPEDLVVVHSTRIAHGRDLAGPDSAEPPLVHENLCRLFPGLAAQYLEGLLTHEEPRIAAWAARTLDTHFTVRCEAPGGPENYARFLALRAAWACVGPSHSDLHGTVDHYAAQGEDGSFSLYTVRTSWDLWDPFRRTRTVVKLTAAPLAHGSEIAALGETDPEATWLNLRRLSRTLAEAYLQALAHDPDPEIAGFARAQIVLDPSRPEPAPVVQDAPEEVPYSKEPARPPEKTRWGRALSMDLNSSLVLRRKTAFLGEARPIGKIPHLNDVRYFVAADEIGAPCLLEFTSIRTRDDAKRIFILELDPHVAHGEEFLSLNIKPENDPPAVVSFFPRLAAEFLLPLMDSDDARMAAWAWKSLAQLNLDAPPALPPWRSLLAREQPGTRPAKPSPHQAAYEEYLIKRAEWVCLDQGDRRVGLPTDRLAPVYLARGEHGTPRLVHVTLVWDERDKIRLKKMQTKTKPLRDARDLALYVRRDHKRVYPSLIARFPELASPFLLGCLEEDRETAAWARKTLVEEHGETPPPPGMASRRGRLLGLFGKKKTLDLDTYRPVFARADADNARPKDADKPDADRLAQEWMQALVDDKAPSELPSAANPEQKAPPTAQAAERMMDAMVRDLYDALPPVRRHELRTAFEQGCIYPHLALGAMYNEHGFDSAEMRNLFAAYLIEVLAPEQGWTDPLAVRLAHEAWKRKKK